MGSNGTVDGAARRSRGRARRARRGVARQPSPARPRARTRAPITMRAVAGLVRSAQPRVVAVPYWSDRHPDHVAASQLLTEAVFNAGLRRYRCGWRGVEARVDLLLLHQRLRGAVVRRGRERALRDEAARAGLLTSASSVRRSLMRCHASDLAALHAADRKPRRAVRRARRRRVCRRHRRETPCCSGRTCCHVVTAR